MKQLTFLLISFLLIAACDKTDNNITNLQVSSDIISKWQVDSVNTYAEDWAGPFGWVDTTYSFFDITYSFLKDSFYIFTSDTIERINSYSANEHSITVNKEDIDFINNSLLVYAESHEEEITWKITTKNDKRMKWYIYGNDGKSWLYSATIYLSRLE